MAWIFFSSSYANRHLEWVRKTKYRPDGFDGFTHTESD